MIKQRAVPLAVVLVVIVAACRARLGDVEIYRAGGRAVGGGDLYGLRIGVHGFTYPPFAAVLFAPLSWLPVAAMWTVLVSASVGALVVIVRRCLPGGLVAVPLAVAAVASQPVLATFLWGQVDLLLAALVLHDLLARRSGVLIGLATAVKLTPGLFIVYLLVSGRRREAGRAIAAFLAASALGAVVDPAASWRFWTREMTSGSGMGGFAYSVNQSIRGWAERFAPHPVAVWAALALVCGVVGLRHARAVSRGGNEVLAAGLVGVTACLVSPVSWTHHWVWCVPLIAGAARVRPGVASALAVVFVLPVLVQPAAVYALAVPAVGLACTHRGRVLDLSWHSARLSASRWCGEARSDWAVRRGRRAPGETCPQE